MAPRLGLADVQSLGQTCTAVRPVVQGLLEAVLDQLIQAGATLPPAPSRLPAGAEQAAVQAERLHVSATCTPRQQLDQWARQAAAIRHGHLQHVQELATINALGVQSALSQPADLVAVAWVTGSVLLAPIPRSPAHVDLRTLVPAHAQTLPAPCTGPGGLALRARRLKWCPLGQALVVWTTAGAQDQIWRITTYRGPKLVGSWAEGVAQSKCLFDLHVAAGATLFWLVLTGNSSTVLTCTPQGVQARVVIAVEACRWALSQDGSCWQPPGKQTACSHAHLVACKYARWVARCGMPCI